VQAGGADPAPQNSANLNHEFSCPASSLPVDRRINRSRSSSISNAAKKPRQLDASIPTIDTAVPWPFPAPSHEDAAADTAGMKATLLRPRPPRLLRQLLSRSALRKLFVLLFVWSVVEAQLVYYRVARAQREFETQDTVLQKPTRVFIASLHWNNAEILRSDWNKGVVGLVDAFGAENVFVSVYESGSWDDSKEALRELDRELEKTGVGKRITLDETTHEEMMRAAPEKEGWIEVHSGELAGKKAPRRIPYLSRLRNLTLQPLLELAKNGTTFDYVLFLGDVVFSVGVFGAGVAGQVLMLSRSLMLLAS
jgi:hypothetical protein